MQISLGKTLRKRTEALPLHTDVISRQNSERENEGTRRAATVTKSSCLSLVSVYSARLTRGNESGLWIPCKTSLLIRGTASDVAGIDSETVLRNTVSESRIVTSEMGKQG